MTYIMFEFQIDTVCVTWNCIQEHFCAFFTVCVDLSGLLRIFRKLLSETSTERWCDVFSYKYIDWNVIVVNIHWPRCDVVVVFGGWLRCEVNDIFIHCLICNVYWKIPKMFLWCTLVELPVHLLLVATYTEKYIFCLIRSIRVFHPVYAYVEIMKYL